MTSPSPHHLFDRREFLRIGGLALGGLGLANVLRAQQRPAVPDTSVILVYCIGGASHLETYDLKPDGPEQMRSVFRPISTRVAGMSICEHLPRHARIANKFSLIRSMTHKVNIHNDGSITTLTGKEPTVLDPTSTARSEHPDFGMITSRLRGPHPAALPQYVSMPNTFHMTRPMYLGSSYQAVSTGDPSRPGWTMPQISLRGQSPRDLENRRRLLRQFDGLRSTRDRHDAHNALDQFHAQAFEVLTSPAVASAFDLQQETPALRDSYGRHLWGQSCLLARRLAEAGTAVISVIANTPRNGPEFTNWDDHPGNAMRPGHFAQYMETRFPYFDQSVAALIDDIHQRDLDRKILVVVVGEFGRTPRIRTGPPDNSIGRDHWPDAYSALIAGGGLRMGQVVGATNARGEYPTDAPVTPQDLLATIYRHLGIDIHHTLTDAVGRPVPVLYHGAPIRQLL
ncbi:MAG: DUF1501 domain-containing protein [Planctomycetes bacterium]|nr:DUF1501 domain-containing protein [Planctomycetota bacterium]